MILELCQSRETAAPLRFSSLVPVTTCFVSVLKVLVDDGCCSMTCKQSLSFVFLDDKPIVSLCKKQVINLRFRVFSGENVEYENLIKKTMKGGKDKNWGSIWAIHVESYRRRSNGGEKRQYLSCQNLNHLILTTQ